MWKMREGVMMNLSVEFGPVPRKLAGRRGTSTKQQATPSLEGGVETAWLGEVGPYPTLKLIIRGKVCQLSVSIMDS